MTLWMIIAWSILVLFGISLVYLGIKIPDLFLFNTTHLSKTTLFILGMLIALSLTGVLTLSLDFINAIVCVFYLAAIWLICDLLFKLIHHTCHFNFPPYLAGGTALFLCTIILIIGWHLNHHIYQTNYTLVTTKEIPNLKIALIADVHLGTTFDAKGFEKHLQLIQKQNPDIVMIVGDYVDDNTSKEQMILATQALGKMPSKYGTYFVMGNHDKGYYGPAHRGFSEQDLINELIKNKITILRDETVLIDNTFYIIGRKDISEENEGHGSRQSMKQLIAPLDQSKYMIVLDHQPADFENQAKAKVDLVLSGHTHGGQLFPFNRVGKAIGANDMTYGHQHQDKTDFIVTSGISSWAIKFKTGTQSEFVIISVKNVSNQ